MTRISYVYPLLWSYKSDKNPPCLLIIMNLINLIKSPMFANYCEVTESDQDLLCLPMIVVREYDLDLLCLPVIVKLQIW